MQQIWFFIFGIINFLPHQLFSSQDKLLIATEKSAKIFTQLQKDIVQKIGYFADEFSFGRVAYFGKFASLCLFTYEKYKDDVKFLKRLPINYHILNPNFNTIDSKLEFPDLGFFVFQNSKKRAHFIADFLTKASSDRLAFVIALYPFYLRPKYWPKDFKIDQSSVHRRALYFMENTYFNKPGSFCALAFLSEKFKKDADQKKIECLCLLKNLKYESFEELKVFTYTLAYKNIEHFKRNFEFYIDFVFPELLQIAEESDLYPSQIEKKRFLNVFFTLFLERVFFAAIESKNTLFVSLFIKKLSAISAIFSTPFNVNVIFNQFGYTPLQLAIQQDSSGIVEILTKCSHVSVNYAGNKKPPMYYAIESKGSSIYHLFNRNDLDLTWVDSENGNTFLHYWALWLPSSIYTFNQLSKHLNTKFLLKLNKNKETYNHILKNVEFKNS